MSAIDEQRFADELKSSVSTVTLDADVLERAMVTGRRRARRRKVVASSVAGVSLVGAAVVGGVLWNQAEPTDTTVATPATTEPEHSEESFALSADFVRSTLDRYGITEFELAPNREAGELVVYLPEPGDLNMAEVLVELYAADERIDGAARISVVQGTTIYEELTELSAQLFAVRASWSDQPEDVVYTAPDGENRSVVVGVREASAAEGLPPTMQLLSGATVAIEIDDEAGPLIEE